MSCDREESVRKLPPGKLKNIRQLFEDGDSNSPTGGKEGRRVPPARPVLPPNRNRSPATRTPGQPKAQPRFRNSSFEAGEGRSLDQEVSNAGSKENEVVSLRQPKTIVGGKVSPTVSRRITSLMGGVSSSNTDENSSNNNSFACKLDNDSHSSSPYSVAQRISNLSGTNIPLDNSQHKSLPENGETAQSSGDSNSNAALADLYSKVNKKKKEEVVTTRNQEPVLNRREAVRKTSDERRRTVATFQPEDIVENSSVSVASRTKMFNQPKPGDKPTPPKKPEVVKRQFSLRSSKEVSPPIASKPKETSEELYDTPWDENKDSAVEKLKRMAKKTPSKLVPVEMNAAVPPKPFLGQKPSLPCTPPPRLAHISKPVDTSSSSSPSSSIPSSNKPSNSPAKPKLGAPPKPPRTHAHDDYLKSRALFSESEKDDETNTNTIKKKHVQITDTKEEEPEYPSIRDRISSMQKLQHSSSDSDGKNTEDAEVTLRHQPPSRPPPPKRRPNSSCTPQSPTKLLQDEGPMMIPISPRRRIARQKSVQPSEPRNPRDELPVPPGRPLTRFPLRKSLSSECVYSRRSQGSDDEEEEQGHFQLTQSTYESEYEAVIDPDGYAVPNEFMKLPVRKKNSDMSWYGEGECPSRFLTRIEGFGPNEAHTPRGKGSNFSFDQDVSPGFGSNTSRHEQCMDKVAKKKMLIVKQKINQAYADLDIVMRPVSQMETEDDVPELKENVVEQSELNKRIEHCFSIRQISRMSIKKSKEYLTAIYPQLFEYCLVVGLKALTNDPGFEPFVIHKFPENVSSNLSVPSFCFPDATIFKPGSMRSLSESYSFVMTYEDGSRVYGYCRRLQLSDASLPEVICIISPIDAFNMYNTLLNEIESRRRISFDLATEVIAAAFGRPLPKPGKVCQIRTLDQNGEMETINLNRPSDNRLANVNYESPLVSLGTDKLVKVFASMLMERRIILCSSNLSILTETVHALCALLYPFQWQHVYIPLLPSEMLDVVCAPMPYIVGILSAFLPQVFQMDLEEEVFVVDLDKKSILRSVGDESTLIPRKIQRALKTAINMCKIDNEARNAQWLMVAEAFLRMFIEVIGHFGSHVCTQQDGNRIFQKEGFIIEMVSKEIRQFLEWFTETQMFEVFIVNHVEKSDWGSCDLFMQRLQDHKETREESRRHKGLGAKVKNFGKAIKTKLAVT